MKLKNQIKKNIINPFLGLISFCLFLVNCGSISVENEDVFSVLTREGNKKTIMTSYDTLVIKNIRIVKPHFSKNEIGGLQIEKDVEELLKEDYCGGLSKTIIKYRVTHLTENFISVVKTVEESFCPHYASDSYYSETLNYIKVGETLYQVKGSSLNKKEIYKLVKEKLSIECTEAADLEYISNDLFFENGKMYALNPISSKECSTILQVELIKQAVDFIKTTLLSGK